MGPGVLSGEQQIHVIPLGPGAGWADMNPCAHSLEGGRDAEP